MATSQIVTADELLQMPSDDNRYELVRGELHAMSPTGRQHGIVTMALGIRLGSFVLQHKLGAVFAAETGFHLEHDPDTVLAPDIAFVERERITATELSAGFWQGAPDLAVEVNSPGDRAAKVAAKTQTWLTQGARQVWIVDPETRTVAIHLQDGQVALLNETDMLTGGDLVPGFACRVGEIFPPDCFQ